MDEEALIVWQDVLDEIAAGRVGDLACPMCSKRPLTVNDQENGGTRVECQHCSKYIEGRFRTM